MTFYFIHVVAFSGCKFLFKKDSYSELQCFCIINLKYIREIWQMQLQNQFVVVQMIFKSMYSFVFSNTQSP